MNKKTEQKKIYIVPGFGETTRFKNYRKVIEAAKDAGFRVVPIKIEWKVNAPMSNFIHQANDQMPDDADRDYVLGFSFGSYILATLAHKKKAKGYFFCSTSPYFKQDLKNIPPASKKYFGKKFMNSLKKYNFPSNINRQAWFFIGDKDWEIAINRTRESYKGWAGRKKLHIIKSVGHDLSAENYVKEISHIINKL